MVTIKTPLPEITSSLPLRLLTVGEYHRMVEVGILHPDERVELIAGQIFKKMSPQGSPHAAAITRTNRLFGKGLGDNVLVRLQLPVILNDFSEPEPDIVLVKVDPLDYDDHHPTAEDVYLIVEIADRTLKSDLTIKQKDYARSGIEDYWVLDVHKRQLYVYREPTEKGYRQEIILGEDDSIAPIQFPDCVIRVAEMLRPVELG
jgi:Uma2 family endonuclease